MLLYLIRHADAVPLGMDSVPTDEERPLTEKGQLQARAVAATLRRQGVRLDQILHSPLVRTEQTAAGIAAAWSTPPPPLVVCEHLAPAGRPRKIAKALRGLQSQSVALVGHMPDIAELAAWMIGSKKARIDIAKAGVAHIVFSEDVDKGEGMLQWLITDAWLV